MKPTREELTNILWGEKDFAAQAQLKKFIADIPDEYFEQEWPQIDDEIFAIWTNGNISNIAYNNHDHSKLLKQGRIKRTLKEAEYKRDLEALYAEMEVWSEKHSDEIDWNDHKQWKFYLTYSYTNGKIVLDFNTYCNHPLIVYVTENCKKGLLTLFGPQLEEIMKR